MQTEKYAERGHRILLVDDDPGLVFMLKVKLDLEGYNVMTANSGLQALERVKEEGLPDLALVDIIMPGMNGREFAEELQSFSDVPVIMLTSVGDEDMIVDMINTCADDYITKPFRPREVMSRIRRVLLRAGTFSQSSGPIIQVDERLGVDFANQCVYIDEQRKNLTPTETKLLYVLIRHTGELLTPAYLQRRLWPHGAVVDEALRVNIYRLRQKIERNPTNPEYLITHRGEGYSFSSILRSQL